MVLGNPGGIVWADAARAGLVVDPAQIEEGEIAMQLSRTSIYKTVAGVAFGAGLVSTSAANAASIIYDLRFSDGSHRKVPTAGSSYSLELWVRVSGTNGNNLDEGLQSTLTSIVSTQSSGGAIGLGGITSVAVSPLFQTFSGTTPLFSNGTSNNISADGIVDWGGTSTASSDPGYILTRANGIQTGPSVGQAVGANAWEFQLATLTIAVNTLGSGFAPVTTFNSTKPFASGGIGVTYIVGRVDNLATSIASNNAARLADTFNNSLGVTFFTPEPASIGLMGAAAIGLLGRRRRMKR